MHLILFKKKIHIEEIFFYTLSLMPLILLLGNAFINSYVIIIDIIFILSLKKIIKLNKIKIDNTDIVLFILAVYLFINFFFSVDKDLSFSRSFFFFRFFLFFFIIKNFIFNLKLRNFDTFFYVISLITFFICLDTYYQYFNGENILGYKYKILGQSIRLSSFLNEEFKIAALLLPFSLIMLGYVFDKINNLIFQIILLLFLFNLFYLIGERSNYYIFIFSIITFIFFSYLEKRKKLIIFLFFIVNFLFQISLNNAQSSRMFSFKNIYPVDTKNSLINNNDIYQKNKITKNNNFKYLFEKKNYFLNSHYASHYYTAIKIFYDYPIFGSGIKTFRKICNETKYEHNLKLNFKRCSTHPHSFLLEILSELGIIGLIIILLFFYSVGKNIIEIIKLKKSNILIFFLIYFFYIYFPFLPRGSFFTSWDAFIFWSMAGMMFAYRNTLKKGL